MHRFFPYQRPTPSHQGVADYTHSYPSKTGQLLLVRQIREKSLDYVIIYE